MKNQFFIFLVIDVAVLLALVVMKTIYFVTATRRRSFFNWIHFSRFNLINSTEATRKLKMRQNALTVLIVVFVVVSLLAWFVLPKTV